MSILSRRSFTLGVIAGTPLLAACGNGVGSNKSQEIDARVDSTLNYLFNTYPTTREIADKSTGMLVMPLVTEGGFIVGGGYGRGALRVGGVTVDYYSATKAASGCRSAPSNSRMFSFT